MATNTFYFGQDNDIIIALSSKGWNTGDQPIKITNVALDYLNNTAFLFNYNVYNTGGLQFFIYGQHVMTASYNGVEPRPATNWTGSIIVPKNADVTIEMRSTDSQKGMCRRFAIKITYENAVHPTVSAGSLITSAQIKELNQYKTGSTASPAQGTLIQPYVIGSAGSIIYASTYNNA